MFLKYFFTEESIAKTGGLVQLPSTGNVYSIFNKTALNVTVAEGFPAQNNV